MAQMYSRIPVSNMQRGERLVYDHMALLPADWVIFHSCKEDYLEEQHYIHFEADFVVLIPQKGLVVIEVKDWPEMRLLHGRWQSRKDSAGPWKTHTHAPLEQANIAMQKIMRSLARCGCIPQSPQRWPEHRHMALLTHGIPVQEGGANNLPFGSLYLCGADELQHLQQRIEVLFVLSQPERMSAHRVRKITESLAPSVRFHMSLGSYLQEMDSAAANILNILPSLYESTGGIRVEGSAGTGKTVMACAEAARLASEAPRDGQHHVLMLCFNHAMAHELQQQPLLMEQKETLLISTFHDFCISHILKPARAEHLVNYHGPGDRLPEEALLYISSLLPQLPHYDAIFVDEAQDFRRQWWDIIQHLLNPGGKLYLFADQHQDLYDRYNQLPELSTRVRLTANLRNAHQVAQFSCAMLPEESRHMNLLPMNGDGVFLSPAADTPEARAAEVHQIIQYLLSSKAGIRLQDIVVLSPWRITHHRCSLSLVPGLAIAPAEETPDLAARRRDNCRSDHATRIFASTIKSFKGQEAAYIIVTDVIGLNESRGFDMKELYTACTRARYGLYIVPSTAGKDLVERYIASAT